MNYLPKYLLQSTISSRFFTILGRNSLKTFALTNFCIKNFAVESEFGINWTLGRLKMHKMCILAKKKA